MAPPSPPSNAQSLLAPPPTPSNKTTFYALLGFSFLHLLVLGAYLIVHATGHTQLLEKGRYLVYALLVIVELCFSVSFIIKMPRPGEAKYVWLPLTGYVVGSLKKAICFDFVTKNPHLFSEIEDSTSSIEDSSSSSSS
ncbi:uncharacterized protein LOC123885565 [Trifolium pratense]|uniref:uncharacterized protein LOC123882996 n=1 Tax=Trifolium pratense TaxID=57577 RepID=UPI001E697CA3|nr:uncharacterized protein LOC123882996 [Trifolium pratense]XP_045790804.1 uncharacterized protein LOC123885565 [Trifolium pratense]